MRSDRLRMEGWTSFSTFMWSQASRCQRRWRISTSMNVWSAINDEKPGQDDDARTRAKTVTRDRRADRSLRLNQYLDYLKARRTSWRRVLWKEWRWSTSIVWIRLKQPPSRRSKGCNWSYACKNWCLPTCMYLCSFSSTSSCLRLQSHTQSFRTERPNEGIFHTPSMAPWWMNVLRG